MSLDSDFTIGYEICSGYHSVVNSKGNIVALTEYKRTFKVFKRSGESRILYEAPRKEHASECHVTAMDIDGEDNLYVITEFLKSNGVSWSFKLFIFDKNGNKKLNSALPFHQNSINTVLIAINKDGKIAILNCEENILYIGDVCVELNSFKVDKSFSVRESYIYAVRFSSFDGTIIVAGRKAVYIYTENGELQRKIENPTRYGRIVSVAINHATKHILVKTKQTSDCSLLSFSETGELQDSLCLGTTSEWIGHAVLKSHPNGPVALVGERGAALLQL